MSGHLGRRVSELLDGQMTTAEADAAWAHVHTCHLCRDDVEREGWVKTRLSSLSWTTDDEACAPDRLKGMLLGMPPGDCFLGGPVNGPMHGSALGPVGHDDLTNRRSRRPGGFVGMAALGGGAAGAAVMGVLALGAAAPADIRTPVPERQQQPVAQVNPSPVPPRVPVRHHPR